MKKKLLFSVISLILLFVMSSCMPNDKNLHTVTFNSNGGSNQAVPQTVKVRDGQPIINLPQPPVRGRLSFESWDTKADGSGYTVDAMTKIGEDLTVYAQWWLSSYSYSQNKNKGIKSISWFPYNNYEYIVIHVETDPYYAIDTIDIKMDGVDYKTTQEWSKILFDPFLDSMFKLTITAVAIPIT